MFLALPALYQIDHTLCLAGSRCAHLVGSFGDSASECVGGFDMSTSNAASAVAWPVSIAPGTFGDGDRHFATKRLCVLLHHVLSTLVRRASD